jgi:hypothetical protein
MIRGAETRLDGTTLVVRMPMGFQRRGGRKQIVAPDGSEIAPATKAQPDGRLVKALARAWRWQRMLDDGVYASVSEVGDAENISKSYVSRILRLALLAPDIVEAILGGTADESLMLETLERPLPASWEEQRRLLGRAPPESTFARARDTCMPMPGAETAKHGVQRPTRCHSGQMTWRHGRQPRSVTEAKHSARLADVGARGRSAASPAWHPVLGDRCKSRQDCRPTRHGRRRE